MTRRRCIATVRQGRLETLEPLGLPEGCPVELVLAVPEGDFEERRMLLEELHDLMQSNPFLGSEAESPRLDW
jgi:hypothetical protein